MGEEDIFRLEITMNNFVLLEQQETTKELLGETADDLRRETTERIGLDELVKIHIKKLSRDAKVATEVEALDEVDHAMFVVGILRIVSYVLSNQRKDT